MPEDTTPIDPEEPVLMKHSKVPGIGGPVPRHAFEGYWKQQGWSEHRPEDSDVTGAITDVQRRVVVPGAPLVKTGLPLETPVAGDDGSPSNSATPSPSSVDASSGKGGK